MVDAIGHHLIIVGKNEGGYMTLEQIFLTLNELQCRIVHLYQRNTRYSVKIFCLLNNKIYNESSLSIADMMDSILEEIVKDLKEAKSS